MVAVPECFPPDRRAIGFLVEKELQILETLLGDPKPPMVSVMGGAKVSDKILIIENLLPKVDHLLVGGAMTYTFLKAQGHAIGKSRCEADKLDEARKLLEKAGAEARPARRPPGRRPPPTRPPRPRSSTAPTSPKAGSAWTSARRRSPLTATLIATAGTVVWNGPMGKFEDEPFRQGTQGRRRGAGGLEGGDGRRRRRDGRGRRGVRLRRQGHPRLDRRRGLPRIPRRENVQLAEGHSRSMTESGARPSSGRRPARRVERHVPDRRPSESEDDRWGRNAKHRRGPTARNGSPGSTRPRRR